MENKQRDKWSAGMAGCCEEDSSQNKAAAQLRYFLPTLTLFASCSLEERIQREKSLMRTSCRPSVRYHSSLLLRLSLSGSFGLQTRACERGLARLRRLSRSYLSLTALMSFSGVRKRKLLWYANEHCQRLREDFCWEDGALTH